MPEEIVGKLLQTDVLHCQDMAIAAAIWQLRVREVSITVIPMHSARSTVISCAD